MVEWKKIKDVCSNICSGGTPNTKNRDYYYGDIPWLRTQEVDWGNIYDTEIKISQKGLDNSSAKIIEKDCVIVAMYGATAAKVAINKIPLSTNQACCNLKINKDISCYRYVYYWLCKEYHKLKALGEGSQNNISGLKIKDYPIPIPSLSEQNRIVLILDTFTASIENLKQQIAQRRKQYEHYREILLDLEGKEGVEIKTLEDVCVIKGEYGLSVSSKPFDGIRYLRITDITDSGNLNDDLVSAVTNDDVSKEPLVDGDILFARTGATVGKTLVYRKEFGLCLFAGYLIRYRFNHLFVLPQYMFHYTHSTKYYKWVKSNIDEGAQPNINAKKYNGLRFPLPPLSEQQRIVSILDTFEASISNLEAQLEQRQKQYEYYRNKLLSFEKEEQ